MELAQNPMARWDEIERLYHDALALDTGEREGSAVSRSKRGGQLIVRRPIRSRSAALQERASIFTRSSTYDGQFSTGFPQARRKSLERGSAVNLMRTGHLCRTSNPVAREDLSNVHRRGD